MTREHRSVRWKKVTLVGVGLLGGSLGKALRTRRLADSVVGFVRRAASVRECKAASAVDSATLDLRSAVAEADLARATANSLAAGARTAVAVHTTGAPVGCTRSDAGAVLAGLAGGTGTVGTTVAGAVATAVSGATNGRGSRAATGVAQTLFMGGIADTLHGRRRISAKDAIAEVGTGARIGQGRAPGQEDGDHATCQGSQRPFQRLPA